MTDITSPLHSRADVERAGADGSMCITNAAKALDRLAKAFASVEVAA